MIKVGMVLGATMMLLVGWMVTAVVFAIPLWLLWTEAGLGAEYFYFLPPPFHEPEFLDVVGLLLTASILRTVLLPPREEKK